jgi:hypothetical protein
MNYHQPLKLVGFFVSFVVRSVLCAPEFLEHEEHKEHEEDFN